MNGNNICSKLNLQCFTKLYNDLTLEDQKTFNDQISSNLWLVKPYGLSVFIHAENKEQLIQKISKTDAYKRIRVDHNSINCIIHGICIICDKNKKECSHSLKNVTDEIWLKLATYDFYNSGLIQYQKITFI